MACAFRPVRTYANVPDEPTRREGGREGWDVRLMLVFPCAVSEGCVVYRIPARRLFSPTKKRGKNPLSLRTCPNELELQSHCMVFAGRRGRGGGGASYLVFEDDHKTERLLGDEVDHRLIVREGDHGHVQALHLVLFLERAGERIVLTGEGVRHTSRVKCDV